MLQFILIYNICQAVFLGRFLRALSSHQIGYPLTYLALNTRLGSRNARLLGEPAFKFGDAQQLLPTEGDGNTWNDFRTSRLLAFASGACSGGRGSHGHSILRGLFSGCLLGCCHISLIY